MKSFNATIIVRHPLEIVWSTLQDELPQLALLMDDIRSVSTLERTNDSKGIVSLTNLWESEPQLPAPVAKMMPQTSMSWIDRALWNLNTRMCDWVIEPRFLPMVTKCSGSTCYESAMGNRGTRITFQGTLEVDARGIPGMPAVLAGTVGSVAETFVTGLIPKNFRKLADAVAKYLETKK